jgi:N-dimethylarginine dimethylaminohydrolase
MIKVHINSEFNSLAVAIFHDASNVMDMRMEDWKLLVDKNELKKHPETAPIKRDLFLSQHNQLRDLLINNNIKLIFPNTETDAPCQVYTRDPSFVIRDTLFVGSMRDYYRHPEIKGLSTVIKDVNNVVNLQTQNSIIEGGDVLVIDNGDVVLVGTGQTTNEAGYQELYKHLKIAEIKTVERIPHLALHLDCCLAPLPDGDALYSKKNLPENSRDLIKKYFKKLIPIDEEEDEQFLAANLLWLNPEELISNTSTQKTNAFLRSKNYIIHEIDFSQPVSMWGSFRCMVCPLIREA